MNKRVLLGITSGIAAYKTINLIQLLQKESIAVSVALTKSAEKMLDQKELKKLKVKIYTGLFSSDFDYREILKQRQVEHINVADTTDLFVIAPATANIIAKLAHGIADDYLTTVALAVTKPLLICPSMNVNMWHNPVTQENIEKLRSFGHHIIEPTEGELACGYVGKGRLEDVRVIKDEILNHLKKTSEFQGKRILVTAGGTTEPIDDVRYITNKSSGKMGVAIAEACYIKGADVTLLRANTSVKPRFLLDEKSFDTTEDLYQLVKKYVKKADIIFHLAAVSDFTVANHTQGKISSKQDLTLSLKPTIKISNEIKEINPQAFLVLFKAEHDLTETKLLRAAKEKMKVAKADIVVANDVSKKDQGFGSDNNEVFILAKSGLYKKISLRSKKDVANALIEFIATNFLQNHDAQLIV